MERKVLLDVEIQTSEAVKASAALQVQIDGLRKSQKDLTKAFNEGEISTEEYSVALTKNKAQVTFLSKEQASYNREVQNSAKAANEAKGSYNQLSAQYSQLKDELNRMSAVERLSTDTGRKKEEQARKLYKQMQSLQEATGKYTLSVGNYEAAIQNVLGDNTAFSNTLQGMQERLRTLTELMQGADVGSKAFKDAQDEAGKLRVQIDQALGKVDEFGDREPKNPLKKAYEDAFEASTGLISGIELLNLSMGDNENMAELQAKATKAVAIAQNLQNVARAKGAIIDTAAIIKTKALAAAQAFYTTVVGTSTGAMKAFRIALISTGVGALVVAVGMLIANFDKVKAVVLKFIPGLEAVGEKVMGIVNAVTDFLGITSEAEREAEKAAKQASDTLDANIKRQEEILEYSGKKYDEYTRRKIQANLDFNKRSKELNEQFKNGEIKSQQELNRLLALERQKADDEINQAQADREEEARKKREENYKKELERRKNFNNQILEVEKQLRDKRIAATVDETEKKFKQIDAAEQDELAALYKKYEETKKLGKLSVDQEKYFTDLRNQIVNDAQTERDKVTKELQDNSLSSKIAALQKERDLENKIANESYSSLVTINQKKLENELKYQQDVLSLLRSQLSESDAAQQAGLLKQISEVQKIINGLQQQITAQTTEQGGGAVQLVLGMTPKQVEKTTQSLQFIQQQFQQLGQIINSGFEIRKNQIDAEYQAEEEAINNSTLSQKQKEKKLEELRKKRAMEEYEIAKEQFIVNQALNIGNTIIAGTLAAIQAVAQLGPIAGAIAAGLIAASTAASVAVIASQPPPPKPQFYDGGFTEQTGNPRAKSKMSNSARDVHHNEYIVPWKVLRQGDAMPHIAALESMRKGTFGTLGLRGFADGGYSTRTLENNANNTAEMAVMVAQAVSNVQIVTKVSDINREQRRAVTNRVRAEI